MVCDVCFGSFCVSEYMLTVSNALFMSSGMYGAVIVEWWLMNRCCVEMCEIWFVMYGSSVFYSGCAITERSCIGLYEVPMFVYVYYTLDVGLIIIIIILLSNIEHTQLDLIKL